MQHVITLLALLAAFVSPAGTPSATDILRRAVEADQRNAPKASQYTYIEEVRQVFHDKNGKVERTDAKTFDVIFLEGEPYKKLIAVDGKPLSAKEQQQVDGDMEKTRADRRERHRGILHFTAKISFGDLQTVLDLFDNRVAGEETVNGRAAWVVDSVPRPDAKPKNKVETDALYTRRRYWFDKEEGAQLKSQQVVLRAHNRFQPGSEFVFEFGKVNDSWQTMRLTMKFELVFFKAMRARGETVQTYSNYRKFDVQSTVTAIEEIKP